MQLICSGGQFYDDKETEVDVHDLQCSRSFDPEIRIVGSDEDEDETALLATLGVSRVPCATLGADGRDVTSSNEGDILTVAIGWNIPKMETTVFQPEIVLCVDNAVYGTLWTRHVIQPSIGFKYIKSGSRPSFKVDTTRTYRFFGGASSSALTKVYKKTEQKKSMINRLGSNIFEGKEIIATKGENYLAKGHLTPDASMVHDFEQKATYYFINAAPQFQAFNNGNWKHLEAKARGLAAKTGRKLTVYQGTQDILTYEDSEGSETELYIDYTTKGVKTSLPIPLYFWKVVYDEKNQQGVGFIGVNDIIEDEYSNLLCDNVCEQLNWIDWKEDFRFDEFVKGRMSCCVLDDDFMSIVNDAPDLRDANNNWPSLLEE